MLCGVRNDDVADILKTKYCSLEKEDFLFEFTFWKMEQMVDFANESEQCCEKEDFLDYRNILLFIFVINEVFLRKFEQDHGLPAQELIKEIIEKFD